MLCRKIASSNQSLRWHDRTSPIRCISRDATVRDPDVDKWLHRLEIFVAEKTEKLGNGDVVHEAAVQIGPAIPIATACDMPERIDPVRVIQVPIKPKDLAEDGLDVAKVSLGESTFLTNPVVASKLRERGGEVGRAERDRSGGAGGVKAAGGVG